MSEEVEKKIGMMTQLLSKLKEAQKEGETVIKHMVELQGHLSAEGFEKFANQLGKIFSLESKSEEEIRKVAHDFEIELNRMKNEAA